MEKIDQILRKLVYAYYPKNICFNKEPARYLASCEYKKLHDRIKKFDSESRQSISKGIIEEFEKNYSLKNFEDFTFLEHGERCMVFSINILKDGELYAISLFVSIIVPFYAVRFRKLKKEFIYQEPKIASVQEISSESTDISDIILVIENFAETRLGQKKFPKDLLHCIIQDISYQNIGIGSFTLFNAFFNNLGLEGTEG